MTFDETSKKWFACSENIVGSKVDDKYPDASLPRIWSLDLDFTTGSVNPTNDSGEDDVITVNPSEKLKLEDIAIVPNTNHVWLASEAHSHLVQTNVFLSKDFGAPDLSSFDPETYSTSRLIRVDVNTGMILEEVPLPEFAQWDQEYNWDARYVKKRIFCVFIICEEKSNSFPRIISILVNASVIVHSREHMHYPYYQHPLTRTLIITFMSASSLHFIRMDLHPWNSVLVPQEYSSTVSNTTATQQIPPHTLSPFAMIRHN